MAYARGAAQVVLVLIGAIDALQLLSSNGPSCVVWHSQHKSAGATIELKLNRFPLAGSGVERADWENNKHAKFHCDRENWECETQRCGIKGYEPMSTNHIAFRGYTPSLAGSKEWGSPGDGKCVWATMSREPISRMVSAYYYCKNRWDNDPLCGKDRLAASQATVREFAEHWGNYLFREFLWNPELRQLAASREDFQPALNCKDRSWKDPWVGFKDQLNGGDDPRTKSGAANLKAVKERLLGTNGAKPLYDVYGVVERWNETMYLFDNAFPLAKTTWMYEGLDAHALHGASAYKDEERRVLAQARTDPVILAALAGDIELYNDVILPKFERDLKPQQANVQLAINSAEGRWSFENPGRSSQTRGLV